MCLPNGEDSTSSGPRTVVDAGMYRASASPKVGYTNGNNGATLLCHVGIFSGACSYCRRSLLISSHTRRGMPLTVRLEQRGGLFFYSAPTLFFGGGRSGSEELPKDNSSSATALLSPDRTGGLPLL